MFNREQWTGDYHSEGVAGIQMEVVNLGNAPLFLRIAFEGSNGARYASTEAFELPADGTWRRRALRPARSVRSRP